MASSQPGKSFAISPKYLPLVAMTSPPSLFLCWLVPRLRS